MVIYKVKEFWGCLKDMKEKWNAEKGGEGEKTLICVKLSKKEGKKLCNIYLPLQRNNSGNDPCNWFNPRGQIKTDFHSSDHN